MEYIGQKNGNGFILNGKMWRTPWKWTAKEIKDNIKKEPRLAAYFQKKQSNSN